MRVVHFTQKESHRSYGALVWGTWVAVFGQRSRSMVLKKYHHERTMAAAFDNCCQQGAARRSSLGRAIPCPGFGYLDHTCHERATE